MPEIKNFECNGLVVNNAWIKAAADKEDIVSLIKALRTMTNYGLKEAKDAIQTNCCHADGRYCADKAIAYFKQWIGPFKTQEEILAEKKAKIDEDENKALFKGLECIITHWQTLGFFDKFQACNVVIENFKLKNLGVEVEPNE